MSGAWLAGLLLTVPVILGLAVEPALFVLADRALDRRPFVRAGYAAVALSALAAALAHNPWLLLAAFTLTAPAWGVGIGVAEAALVELDPARAEKQLTRWTLAGAIGDVAGPALLAGAAACGLDWRAAFAAIAVWAALSAAAVPRLPRPRTAAAGEPDGEERLPLRRALAEALRNRRLLAWSVGVTLCSLLDEILLVLAALHLAASGASPAERALTLAVLLGGSAVGLAVVERLLHRVRPLRLLAALTAVCAIAHIAWVFFPTGAVGLVLAAVVGLTDSSQYPLAKAQAYRAAPGQAGRVNAIAALLHPIEAAAPLLLALLADHAGVTTALLVLTAQPIGLLVLALRPDRDP